MPPKPNMIRRRTDAIQVLKAVRQLRRNLKKVSRIPPERLSIADQNRFSMEGRKMLTEAEKRANAAYKAITAVHEIIPKMIDWDNRYWKLLHDPPEPKQVAPSKKITTNS